MKIKLKNSSFQTIMEFIAIAVLTGFYIYLLLRWNSVPDKIPGHYNALGEIDRWSSKGELIILPIASTLLYLLLTVVQFFPSTWNVPVTVTQENRDKVYHTVKTMLILIKVEALILFFYLSINQIEVKSLPPIFLPISLVVIFGTIAFFIQRTIQVSKG